jgi:DNA-binding Lrp family transcriptional regulator
VLRGYHAEVDARAVGARLPAMIMVRLNKHPRAVVEAFRSAMHELPEILDVYLVGGVHDFLA